MYLKLDTRFNPFTYDEMVKPLLYYKQAYDEAEAAYSDLVTQTEAWKDIANRENSPEAFEMYQRYSGDLSRAVEDFSQGMTAKNRRALLGLKRRYAQDITPIARASEAMKEANALRVNAGPDAIFEVGEYNSLDSFLHGKTANNKYQSREALTKRAAAMTEAAMTEALRDPDFKKAMGDQFWMITQHTGGSYEDLIEAMKVGMADNPIAQNRFSEIRQSLIQKAGIQNYDAVGQQAIIDAIDTGLYAGLDKPTRQFSANQGFLNPLQQEQLNQLKSNSAGDDGNSSRRSGRKSSSNESSSTEEEGVYVANNIIYEKNSKGRWAVPQDMSPSDFHGSLTEFDELNREYKQIVEKHLGGSDPRQYEFYTWKTSTTGSPRIQIMRKQSYTKPGPNSPSESYNPTNNYLESD